MWQPIGLSVAAVMAPRKRPTPSFSQGDRVGGERRGVEPGPPPTVAPDVVAVEGWILGQGGHAAQPSPTSSLPRLAALVRQRNAIDEEIAALIGRPALPGRIGELIAAEVFDIELERSAAAAGYDGVFRSGHLAGATVNVKFYPKREGLLDIPEAVPDYFLVLTGPRSAAAASSVGTTRPLVATTGTGPAIPDRGTSPGTASSLQLNAPWARRPP